MLNLKVRGEQFSWLQLNDVRVAFIGCFVWYYNTSKKVENVSGTGQLQLAFACAASQMQTEWNFSSQERNSKGHWGFHCQHMKLFVQQRRATWQLKMMDSAGNSIPGSARSHTLKKLTSVGAQVKTRRLWNNWRRQHKGLLVVTKMGYTGQKTMRLTTTIIFWHLPNSVTGPKVARKSVSQTTILRKESGGIAQSVRL